MTDEPTNDEPKTGNLFSIVQGGKQDEDNGYDEDADEKTIPELDYVIVDLDDVEYSVKGFVVFTPQHLAIMRDNDDGRGPIPVVMFPLSRIKVVGLEEELNEEV